MTKVMNMMAAEAEKGPIELKSHLDNIVFYQLFTLCFGEKWVHVQSIQLQIEYENKNDFYYDLVLDFFLRLMCSSFNSQLANTKKKIVYNKS